MKKILLYGFAIMLWIVAAALWVMKVTFLVFAILLLFHLIEFFLVGLRAGLKDGQSLIRSIIMCMLFGIIWWKPLTDKNKERGSFK